MNLKITLTGEVNTSLQIGDDVYHSMPSSSGEFQVVDLPTDLIHIGKVYDIISPYKIQVYSTHVCTAVGVPVGCTSASGPVPGIQPPANSYISFSKSAVVNNSDIIGYYAKVDFENNRTDNIELFSIGSEITENSK